MSKREELLAMVIDMNDVALTGLLRVARRLAISDGSGDALTVFLKDNGGVDAVGVDKVMAFIDEWEATHGN